MNIHAVEADTLDSMAEFVSVSEAHKLVTPFGGPMYTGLFLVVNSRTTIVQLGRTEGIF